MFPIPFQFTVEVVRAAAPAETDQWGQVVRAARTETRFAAVYVPPGRASGTRLVDGVLQETTVTKPTLYVEGTVDVESGDDLTVDGVPGFQVDGTPNVYRNPWTGWGPFTEIELRRTEG